MIVNFENLQTLADNVENTLTQTLGFELPNELNLDQALMLLTTVQEPLRTEIKERLATMSYVPCDYDVRWTVLSVLVKFGVRHGGMKAVGLDVAREFYDALSQTGDRVYEMLQDTRRVPPTRYGYLKSIVAGLVCGFKDYDPARLKFINKQNFIVLDDAALRDYYAKSSEFAGVSELITRTAKEFCVDISGCYTELPRIVERLNWISSKEDLQNFKTHLQMRVHLLRVFNELLDDF